MAYCKQKDLNNIACDQCILYTICPPGYFTNGPKIPIEERKQRFD